MEGDRRLPCSNPIVVYENGTQVGQSYKDLPRPEDLIHYARTLLAE